MKITLKNFGPIAHFEFDVDKDMHVIFGKNNIGKSYAITAVYLILKNFLEYLPNIFNAQKHKYNVTYTKAHGEIPLSVTENGGKEINVTNRIEEILLAYFETKLIGIENSFKNSFPPIVSLPNSKAKEILKIEIKFHDFNIVIKNNESKLFLESVTLSQKVLAAKSPEVISPEVNKENTFFIFTKEGSLSDLQSSIDHLLHNSRKELLTKISSVHFLPASRSGLYQALGSLSSIIVELSKSRNFLRNKLEIPSLTETVSDYFLSLGNIDVSTNLTFKDAISVLENEILKGTVSFNNETKRIMFKANGMNDDLELTFVSSMVSEIAPIVAYLKFIVSKEAKDWDIFLWNIDKTESIANCSLLFIEEPEAHLHPEVQVKLMELFALLAGNRVKIVMTSHSNYMFNKLSNLLLEGKVNAERVASYLMRATDVGSVTDMLAMKAEADGMNDDNFADTSEMLYEERIKIYDQLNNEAGNAA